MARAIALRSDFSGAQLRALARHSKDAAQARRLLALAGIYDGGARHEAARLGDVTLQILRATMRHRRPEVHPLLATTPRPIRDQYR